MRVVDPGHGYELASLDGGEPVSLVFVKREGSGYPGNLSSHPGTTMQECLRALIDRATYVNAPIPCAETSAAIGLMRATILLLELRAARRHGRTLEADTLAKIEHWSICDKCSHVGCDGSCH